MHQSFIGVLIVLFRWRVTPRESILPAERLMRTGIRYVRYAPAVHAVFGADVGLHPVPRRALGIASVGRQNRNETRPAAYGQLLSALGAGALIGAAMLPKLKAIASIDGLITSAQ